jgi:UDP-glucose 4-epimerase
VNVNGETMRKDNKVLITGGAGYIGSHAVSVLRKRGYSAVVVDDLSTGHRQMLPRDVPFANFDIHDTGLLAEVLKEYRIDAVMHFASSSIVADSVADPIAYYRNNVAGALSLLEAMRRAEVHKLVFSSSAAVYGEPEKVPLTERHVCDPVNPYGRTKLFIENMLEDAAKAYGVKYVSLRYFNCAGADPASGIGEWHEPETHLIPLVLQAAEGIIPFLKLYGSSYDTRDGTCIRDFIHVQDLIEAHILSLEYMETNAAGEIFNLGSEEGVSIMEVIRACEKVTGKKVPFREEPPRAGDPAVLVASSEKAKELLGWGPERTDLDTMIKDAYEWHLRLYGTIRKEL